MPTALDALSLLFTDLDGTLLTVDETVEKSTTNRLKSARARGVAVVPATARGIRGVSDVAALAPLGPIAVCHNGAVGYHLEQKSLLWTRDLSRDFVRSLIEDLRNSDDGFYFAASSPTQFRPQHGFFRHADVEPYEFSLRELFDLEPIVKVICRHRDHRASELIEILAARFPGVPLISGATDWVEILPKGVSKGFGVGLAADYLGVDLGDTVAVGDHLNDLPMLAVVGHPFAVANAHRLVRAAAEELLPSNDAGGVGELVARMGLA